MFTDDDTILKIACGLGFNKEALIKHFNKIKQKDAFFSPKSSFMFIAYNDNIKEKDLMTYRIHRALIDLIEDAGYKYAMVIDNPTGKTMLLQGAACQEITQNATMDMKEKGTEVVDGETFDTYTIVLSIKKPLLTLGSRRILDYMKE